MKILTLTATALILGASVATAEEVYEPNRIFYDDDEPVSAVGRTWVDPLGCEFNLFTDGTEGYLSEKLNRDGSAVCGSQPTVATNPVWIDPDGCAHWMINSGAKGYLATVRFANGRPSCGSAAQGLAARFGQSRLLATTWRDPNGCFHWVADDGFEGFMSARLRADGTPVCDGAAGPTTLTLAADALFDVDKSVLKPTAVAELTEFFELMNKLNKSRIAVVGHTDSDASEAYNQALSVRRAQAVADFGAQYGVTSDIAGRGELDPVAPNDTRANKAKNRRVEITVLD